jgi:hypothetical protein
MNADDVTDARFQCEAPGLKEANSIDVQPFGMDLVAQDLGGCKGLSRFAIPIVPDQLLHGLNLLLRKYRPY